MAVPPSLDVEDQRLFASVHARLFGGAQGVLVGRYTLRRPLGAGAMGEVHLAHDEELEREVAIKLVHGHLAGERWTDRMRREARALARLAHPNVVHVYEVGEVDGRMFLAMEYVDGESLRAWLDAQPRRPAQIIEVYLAAARGLAAAHGAGIIHRDFKPDNVLRSHDGRVVVADFGLAALDTVAEIDDAETTDEDARDARLSRTGELKGTPAYMAPEQLEARTVDARADQFALCVALYEALWGTRPFPERSLAGRLAAICGEGPKPPPRRDGVPRWIWPVIRRGLAANPEHRWPDVDALIGELERRPRRRQRRRRSLVLASSLAVSLAVGGLVARSASVTVDPCAGIDRELLGVWDFDAELRLTRAFAATERSWAEDASVRAVAGLDRWRAGWLDERRQACEDHQARPDATEVARRIACLERQRERVAGLVAEFSAADVRTVEAAVVAVDALEPARSCAAAESLAQLELPPAEQLSEVGELRVQLAEVLAKVETGHPERALAQAEAVEQRVVALAYRPLAAESALALGRALMGLGRFEDGLAALERAANLGEAARHDALVVETWLRMTTHAAVDLEDPVRGRRWLARALAANLRIGEPRTSTALLANAEGHLALLDRDPVTAEQRFSTALAGLDGQSSSAQGPAIRGALGQALVRQGRSEAALREYERALDEAVERFGSEHPAVAPRARDLGLALLDAERPEPARVQLTRAVNIWMAAEHELAPGLGDAYLILAAFAFETGDFEAAARDCELARDIYARSYPPEHLNHVDVRAGLAAIEYVAGEPEQAIAGFRFALDRYRSELGDRDPLVSQVRVNLGWALLVAGHRADAQLELAAARAQLRELQGHERGDDSTRAMLGLAVAAAADDRLTDAVKLLAELEPERLEPNSARGWALLAQVVGERENADDLAAAGRALALEARGHDDPAWAQEQRYLLEILAVSPSQLGDSIGLDSDPAPDLDPAPEGERPNARQRR